LSSPRNPDSFGFGVHHRQYRIVHRIYDLSIVNPLVPQIGERVEHNCPFIFADIEFSLLHGCASSRCFHYIWSNSGGAKDTFCQGSFSRKFILVLISGGEGQAAFNNSSADSTFGVMLMNKMASVVKREV
jgi:hypothetical protein